MGIDVGLKTPGARGGVARINKPDAIRVATIYHFAKDLPNDLLTAQKYFSENFKDSAGSANLDVNGSVTNVDFEIKTDGDIKFVKKVRFLLQDDNLDITTQDSRRFGSATAANTPLTNGIQFFTMQGGIQTDIFTSPVKVLGDFLNYYNAFTNLPNSISATVDFFAVDFVFEQPIVIPQGTLDKLVIRIRDDITAVDSFQVLATGWHELV